jgi:hypothetical protein
MFRVIRELPFLAFRTTINFYFNRLERVRRTKEDEHSLGGEWVRRWREFWA